MNDPQPEGHMASYLGRRKFFATLGGAAAWPLAARAQQSAIPVIGILAVTAPEANEIRLRAFREGLRTAGHIDDQNVKIQYRWAEAHTGRLPELAAGLVRDRVAVLVAAGGVASAVAAKGATRAEAGWGGSRTAPLGHQHGASGQPGGSCYCRARFAQLTDGSASARVSAPHRECQHRSRLRCGVRKVD